MSGHSVNTNSVTGLIIPVFKGLSLDDSTSRSSNLGDSTRRGSSINIPSASVSGEGDAVSSGCAWQDSLDTSSAALNFLLNTGTHSDITLVVGSEGKQFRASILYVKEYKML